jgi:hypothetical protein
MSAAPGVAQSTIWSGQGPRTAVTPFLGKGAGRKEVT